MDSPSSNNASNQPIEEETQNQNQNQSQNQSPSPSQSRSPSADPIMNSEEKAIVPMEEAPLDQQENDLQLAIPEEDREYGCKFCEKKFSNKQALGGHQNAHKIERSVEKTTRDMHETAVGYFTGATSSPSNPPPILNSTFQRNDLINRAYISWPAYYNHPRPLIQMPDPNYGPRPVFNNVYHPGWPQPPPRLPFNPNYQPAYMGFQRPVYDLPPPIGFPGPLRLGPDRNPEINFANLRGEDYDESGLDLTLRL